jgi:uncharacterized protein (TIGR02453 family)
LSGIISPALFTFLKSLARNNDREWFEANKQRYIDDVRDPLCAFVEAVGPKLRAIHPDVIADPRPNGGSLFRIYRDTRFSKDKTPYKTSAALRFQCGPKKLPSPGFYLGLEPGSVMVAAGIWHPPTDVLKLLRDAIDHDAGGWKKARKIGLDDVPMYKRPPRGFDADHPFIEDLKRKSFTTRTSFSEKQACAKDFPARFAKTCRTYKPFVDFLSSSLAT